MIVKMVFYVQKFKFQIIFVFNEECYRKNMQKWFINTNAPGRDWMMKTRNRDLLKTDEEIRQNS